MAKTIPRSATRPWESGWSLPGMALAICTYTGGCDAGVEPGAAQGKGGSKSGGEVSGGGGRTGAGGSGGAGSAGIRAGAGGGSGGAVGGGTSGTTSGVNSGGGQGGAGKAGSGGTTFAEARWDAGGLDAGGLDVGGLDVASLPRFSFFVTSLVAMRAVSGSQNGFGGDLRFGETGTGAGLRGADKICATIAERSMPGANAKPWRAFLSTSTTSAIDRVGTGPWYDRKGRLVARTTTDLVNNRPGSADPAIANDLPNEDGVPNHAPDGTRVDNHDTLTGSNNQGRLFGDSATCSDWTSLSGSPPRVGHAWPGGPSPNWINAHNAGGCAAGVNLASNPPGGSGNSVGSGGGYGALYCFALVP